jgi:HEAT repeat protein
MKNLVTILIFLSICFANGNQDDKGFKKYYLGYQKIMDSNWKQGIKLLNEMSKEFPKSKFIDDAKYWTAYATQELGQTKNAADLYVKFIENYKESNLADDAKRNLIRLVMKFDKEEQEKYKEHLLLYERQTGSRALAELRERESALTAARSSLAYVDGRIASTHPYNKISEEDELKESAIQAISQRGGKKAAAKLRSIAMDDKQSQRVREKAMFWYAQMDETTAKDLQEMFSSTSNEHLREKLIFNVSQKSGKEATEMMVKIFKNKGLSSRLREKALFWISQSKPQYFAASIKDILKSTEGDTRLREKLMFSIGQSQMKEKNDYLFRFATDQNEDNRIREKAIFWLGQNKGSMAQLKKIYASLDDDRLREKLIFSFSQQNSNESIDYMIELLKAKSTSTRIKKKIVFWLGQSKNEKAQDAILDLID